MMKQTHNATIEKARSTAELSHEELVELLNLPQQQLPSLMAAADEVRQRTVGNQVHNSQLLSYFAFLL